MKGRQPKTEVVRLPTQPITKHLEQSDDNHLDISRLVCVFLPCFFVFLFSCLEPKQSSKDGTPIVTTSIRVSKSCTTPYSTLTSKVLCKKGVKGVDKPIFWYFREKSQTNHKLMGTSCICVMYVSRGFYNVSVDERNKIVMVGSIWW